MLKKAQPLNGTDQYTQGCNEALFAITSYTYYTDAEAQAMGCNAKGLLKLETDPNGHITTYTYDTYGNVLTVIDPENKTTTYNYNNLGWKTSVVSPKEYTTSYVYDLNGNLEQETLQGGEVTRIIFITNDVTIPQTEIIQRYREKNKIEEAFREMKSQLALRPIHLTRPERVKAHVTVCILAYLLVNTMEVMLKKTGNSISPIDVLKQVKSCQLNQVGIKGSTGYSLTVTEMTEEQIEWTKIFNCENLLKPKVLKLITKSLENTL